MKQKQTTGKKKKRDFLKRRSEEVKATMNTKNEKKNVDRKVLNFLFTYQQVNTRLILQRENQ